MSASTSLRYALRSYQAPAASTSRISVRSLSCAVGSSGSSSSRGRLSPVALGKRPAVNHHHHHNLLGQRRNLSWLPWGSSSPAPEQSSPGNVDLSDQGVTTSASASTPPSSQPHTIDSIMSRGQSDPATTSTIPSASSTPLESAAPSTGTPPSSIPQDNSAVDLLPDNLLNSTASSSTSLDAISGAVQPGRTLSEVIAANPHIPFKELLHTPEAVNASASTADLASLGLTHGWFNFSGWLTDVLVSLHYYTGLPWYATIFLTVAGIRALLVPMLVSTTKHNIRFAAINPEMRAFQERLKRAQAENDADGQRQTVQAMQLMMRDNNVNPLRMIKVPLANGFVFISMYYGLTKLCTTPFPQFLQGGCLWFQDLTVPDPYWILPIASMFFTNWVVRVGADGTGAQVKTELQRHMKNIVMFVTVPSVFWVQTFPAGVLMYWTTANLMSLLTAYALRAAPVKRFFNIPEAVKPVEVAGQKVEAPPSARETYVWIKKAAIGKWKSTVQQAEERQARAIMERSRKKSGSGPQRSTKRRSETIIEVDKTPKRD